MACPVKNQSGQALVSGLVLFTMLLFFGIYCLFICESMGKKYKYQEKALEDKLFLVSHAANAIDQISINNQAILAAVSLSQEAFSNAFSFSALIADTQPYWKTYSALKNKKNAIEPSRSWIQKIYMTYADSAARGFFIAKALSEKNQKLVNDLPKKIGLYFKQIDNDQLNCLVLEIQKEKQSKLKKDKCSLLYPSSSNKILKSTKSVPRLYPWGKDNVISFEEMNRLSSAYGLDFKNQQYGIWIVPVERRLDFMKELQFPLESVLNLEKSKNDIQRIKIDQSFCVFLSHANLSKNDLDVKKSENKFIQSFFMPQWAAVVRTCEVKHAK